MSEQLINCPYQLDIPISKPFSKADYLKIIIENLKKCNVFWKTNKVDLAAYNTTKNAKDLDDLRNVLEVDKISLWSINNGLSSPTSGNFRGFSIWNLFAKLGA